MTSPDRPFSPADVPDLTLVEFLLAGLAEVRGVAVGRPAAAARPAPEERGGLTGERRQDP